MGRGNICMFLYWQICFCSSKVILEKRLGTEEDLTPICSSASIIAVHCYIRTHQNSSVLCSLLYVPGRMNESHCGSRVSLLSRDQAVFLRLVDLRPENSGLYNCECTATNRVYEIHLNVTVEVDELATLEHSDTDSHANIFIITVIVLASCILFIIIFGVILGCICKRKCCRARSQPAVKEEEETYEILQQPTNDLYQTVADCKRDRVKEQHGKQDKSSLM